MGNVAYKIESALPRVPQYQRAVAVLTTESKKVAAEERVRAIEFFARLAESADAVMVLGSALTDYGKNFTRAERKALAAALSKTGECPLSQALARSFMKRAVALEIDQEVRESLEAVLRLFA